MTPTRREQRRPRGAFDFHRTLLLAVIGGAAGGLIGLAAFLLRKR